MLREADFEVGKNVELYSGLSLLSKLFHSPEKRERLEAAKANAMNILGQENVELPESVKPILPEQSVESKWASTEPEARVRQDPEKSPSQVGVLRVTVDFTLNPSHN